MPTKLVPFDPDNKLHQDLFNEFKQQLIYSSLKNELLVRFDNQIDDADITFRTIAIDELELDPEIEEYDTNWQAVIYSNDPEHFGVIVGFEYEDFSTNKQCSDFIKVCGTLLVENEQHIIFDIDVSDVDYSSKKEFDKAKNSFKFKK